MTEADLHAIVERAARIEPFAGPIRDLAGELDPATVDGALAAAVEGREIDGATILALTALAQGRVVDAELVERIYPDAFDERAAQLLIVTHPDRRGILERILGSRRPDRYQLAQAAALYLHLFADEPPPAILMEILRNLSRARPGWIGEGWAVQAVLRLNDADLNARYKIDPRLDVIDAEIFEGFTPDATLDALKSSGEKVVASGFTAHRAAPKVGRNDPCPCGSGKKYKKCHFGKGDDAALSPRAGLTIREYRVRLHELCGPAELARQHPADLARLPFDALSPEQAEACLGVFLDCERMDEAVALMDVLAPKIDAKKADELRTVLVEFAHEYGMNELVEDQLAKVGDDAVLPEYLGLGRALRSGDAAHLELLEVVSQAHFVEAGPPPLDVAYELLDLYPALGILVARGCLDPKHEEASLRLLDEIEHARDALGAPPDDPYWAVMDRMVMEMRLERASDAEKIALRGELELLRAEAQDARARAHVLSRELNQKEDALGELESRARNAEARAGAARATKDEAAAKKEAEEAQRLRKKIRELQSTIREGQAERADLRRRTDELASAQASAAVTEKPEETGADEDAGAAIGPHGLRVPVWSDKALSSLEKLPKNIVASAIAASGALGAGRPEAWRHAKQLEGLHGLCSARVGIHHRVLFRVERDGLLDVDEVITREDLDRALAVRR